eukprot:6749587-Pyramimonas_sp.AAC.1
MLSVRIGRGRKFRYQRVRTETPLTPRALAGRTGRRLTSGIDVGAGIPKGASTWAAIDGQVIRRGNKSTRTKALK